MAYREVQIFQCMMNLPDVILDTFWQDMNSQQLIWLMDLEELAENPVFVLRHLDLVLLTF